MDDKDPEKSDKEAEVEEEESGSGDEGGESRSKVDESGSEVEESGSEKGVSSNAEDESSNEADPLTPSVLPMEDADGDNKLTDAEAKVQRKLRKQQSEYEDEDMDDKEKEGLNGKVSNNAELSPFDHWSSVPLVPPPSYENATQIPQLSDDDHWSTKKEEKNENPSFGYKRLISNEEPPPDTNGMATTSFIQPPRFDPSSYLYQRRAEAPIASGEEELTDTEIKPKKLKPALKATRPVVPSGDTIEMRQIELHDMENAEPPEEEEEAYECTSLGWFNCCGTVLVRIYSQLCTAHSTISRSKRVLGIMAIVMLLGLVLFIGVFSTSFEYVNYYHIALKKSRMTGAVNREDVIYPGCYVLGPDVDLLFFDATAQTITSRVSVFTSDRLVVDVDVYLQYFLRPEELGKLYTKFDRDFHPTLEALAYNSIKNEGTKHSLDTYRLNRPELEKLLFQSVRERLGGNCCPSCCPKNCVDQVNKTICSVCKPVGSCDQGYHVDVDYFQMGRVIIPGEVFDRYLKQTILLIESDREVFIQEHAVVQKNTSREVEKIKNDAREVRANATAFSKTIHLVAEAEKEATVQMSYITAWKKMFSRLNFTQEDHKTSLMMMRAYEDIKDNLFSYGFEKETLNNL